MRRRGGKDRSLDVITEVVEASKVVVAEDFDELSLESLPFREETSWETQVEVLRTAGKQRLRRLNLLGKTHNSDAHPITCQAGMAGFSGDHDILSKNRTPRARYGS